MISLSQLILCCVEQLKPQSMAPEIDQNQQLALVNTDHEN